jgi:hypothetical protein
MLLFEAETCGRCGGSGHHSYCQSYGSTCFKCHGKKQVLTKRGAVAQALYSSLCMKRVDQLQPGDKFQDLMISGGGDMAYAWFTVQNVRPDTSRQSSLVNGIMVPGRQDLLAVETDNCLFAGWTPDRRIKVAIPATAKQNLAMIALAYQSILSKTGKEPSWLKSIAWG